jgi:hypothetical protein
MCKVLEGGGVGSLVWCCVICANLGVWGEGWNQIKIRGVGVEMAPPERKVSSCAIIHSHHSDPAVVR